MVHQIHEDVYIHTEKKILECHTDASNYSEAVLCWHMSDLTTLYVYIFRKCSCCSTSMGYWWSDIGRENAGNIRVWLNCKYLLKKNANRRFLIKDEELISA